MRVFVAGATGAVGRRLLPMLAQSGHDVVGLSRTPDKAQSIRESGAEPVIADALDAASVRAAVLAAKPDVVVHQMTALAGMTDLRKFDRSFALSNRLRTEGLDNLIAAGKESGARRIVVQSFCGWPYARTGNPVKTEEDVLDPHPPRELKRTLDAIRYLESTVTGLTDLQGAVLRYGVFYGPDTGMMDRIMIDQVRRRMVPLVGSGNGWWSFVHIDDVAAATALAVMNDATGVYNIVDDDPAPVREWLPELARILGAKAPWRIPAWIARIVAGEHIVAMMTEARAGSNAKVKCDFSWQPAHRTWRQGFAEIASRLA